MIYNIKLRSGKLSVIDVPCEKVGYLLQCAYDHKYRVRVWYGDTLTGRAWNDFYDIKGTISASTGDHPILLLKARASSFGGGGLLTSHIVRIDIVKERRPIYQHINFHVTDLDGYSAKETAFLRGERYAI